MPRTLKVTPWAARPQLPAPDVTLVNPVEKPPAWALSPLTASKVDPGFEPAKINCELFAKKFL